MANRTGMFLKEEDRVSLIQELKTKGELKAGSVLECAAAKFESSSLPAANNECSFGTGCLTCGEDDDHANLLLCEVCNDEYHTYCLDPPLRSVPTGDWFCAKCKVPSYQFQDDGLDKLVSALPPSSTERFGEVCWAQGGVGFGWWPSFIYDPRLTVGNARQLARKNLGKRHLVYFFECHDAPFACLSGAKITKWEDGLMEDYHLGKTARAAGKARTTIFQQALQAATVEAGKPIEMRMDWNHTDQPQILPSPEKAKKPKQRASKERKRVREEEKERYLGGRQSSQQSSKKKLRGFGFLPEFPGSQPQLSTRRNLSQAIEALAAAKSANQIESSEDGELFCTLLKKTIVPNAKSNPECLNNIGFVKLKSRKTCTFAEARAVIQEELVPDGISLDTEWRFFVPPLGPASIKQEQTLGPMFPFLKSTTTNANLGKGNLLHPLKVIIVDAPLALNTVGLQRNESAKNSVESENSESGKV